MKNSKKVRLTLKKSHSLSLFLRVRLPFFKFLILEKPELFWLFDTNFFRIFKREKPELFWLFETHIFQNFDTWKSQNYSDLHTNSSWENFPNCQNNISLYKS